MLVATATVLLTRDRENCKTQCCDWLMRGEEGASTAAVVWRMGASTEREQPGVAGGLPRGTICADIGQYHLSH